MITLSSARYEITKIKKQTKAEFYNMIDQGDVIRFEMDLVGRGRGSRGILANLPIVYNMTKGTFNQSKSQTEINNLLKNNFELREV